MERLQKVIANAGYCSRRKAEELIANNKVMVNDKIVNTMGFKVSKSDQIKINGQLLVNRSNEKIYIMFYKPRYCLSTTSDPKKRKTVMNYFKSINHRIYPVGRLDYDTSGLLLLTNDGDFANLITHPKHIVEKKYQVLVNGILDYKALSQLKKGIKLEENFTTQPAKVKILKTLEDEKQSVVEIIIHEGHKHQVKNMFKAVGYEVLKLKRTAISFLQLDKDLKPGQWRYLKPKEVKLFFAIAKKSNL